MVCITKNSKNKSITEKLLELREMAGDDQHLIIRYHLLVSRYLRMKSRRYGMLNTYAKMQGIHA